MSSANVLFVKQVHQRCNFVLVPCIDFKSKKEGKIQDRYNQAPHLTQDTNGKVTTSQLDITNDSQEVSPFPAGDHKASINRCAQNQRWIKTHFGKWQNTINTTAKRSALSQQVTMRLQGTDTTHTTWSLTDKKRSTKEAPPWIGQ